MEQQLVQFPRLKPCSAFRLLPTHPSQPIEKNTTSLGHKRISEPATEKRKKITRKPTCKLRHCEFFHLTGSRSLMPVIVPMYLQNVNIRKYEL